MRNGNIDTIFFDVGATLRYVVEDAEFAADAGFLSDIWGSS